MALSFIAQGLDEIMSIIELHLELIDELFKLGLIFKNRSYFSFVVRSLGFLGGV